MTVWGWIQFAVVSALVGGLVSPLGGYMEAVFSGRSHVFRPLLGRLESFLYRMAGVGAEHEQSWAEYARALLTFNLVGVLAAYGILRLQASLPFNPQRLSAVDPVLALNAAVSFGTNTSWQSYGGETTLSAFSQMFAITVQSYLSAATGIAAAIALIRGFSQSTKGTIGNFWVDMTRAVLYVLLPVCLFSSVLLISQGVPQTLSGSIEATTLEGGRQAIAMGPVASQIGIKMLSSDGGGYFNANSAHPYENPNALTDLYEMALIFLIGAALTNTFGRQIGDRRQGWALLGAMALLFALGFAAIYWSESCANPAFGNLPIDQASGNMEGKEARFGIAGSALFAAVTTDSSSGAVNAMHDSFSPLGGGVAMLNMMLGEVIVGGAGSGLFGILLFCIVTVFVAGLMIGRTPEYAAKKIESNEIKLTLLALLCVPATALGLSAIAVVVPAGMAGMANSGPHGFSEVLYAYTSAAATNGSAFAGLNANTPFYNLTLAAAMFAGRFFVIIPVLAIAGSLAAKRPVRASAGTLPTQSLLFVVLLACLILIVGGLTYFPALALGPVVEHFNLPALQAK